MRGRQVGSMDEPKTAGCLWERWTATIREVPREDLFQNSAEMLRQDTRPVAHHPSTFRRVLHLTELKLLRIPLDCGVRFIVVFCETAV